MASKRNCLVILDPTGSSLPGHCYLGEIDRGVRQGVRQLENAIRFTAVGARRVAAGYRNATVLEVLW